MANTREDPFFVSLCSSGSQIIRSEQMAARKPGKWGYSDLPLFVVGTFLFPIFVVTHHQPWSKMLSGGFQK